MAKKNEPIGTVPCPFIGCGQACQLFKYRPRDDGRRSAFTGKWYAECPEHGRIDGASSQKTQDYLIDKGDVWGARKPDAAEPENPEKAAPNPEKQPLPPVRATPPKPEPKPEPTPPPQPPKPEKTGWGFFT